MDIEEEIREAFRCFDKKGHGFITVPGDTFHCIHLLSPLFLDLTRVLEKLGDKLSFEETQVCFFMVFDQLCTKTE